MLPIAWTAAIGALLIAATVMALLGVRAARPARARTAAPTEEPDGGAQRQAPAEPLGLPVAPRRHAWRLYRRAFDTDVK